MHDTSPILIMEHVRKCFATARGPVTVLHDVDLRVERGEFTAVTGPSGSGKTTLLNLAALLDGPTAGRIVFQGTDVSGFGDAGLCELRKRRIGMVFQRFCLLSHRSVLDNVRFRFRYLDTPAGEAAARSAAALETVGLWALRDQPARLLSGGEMQRAAIARAIAVEPDLLLADEPTGNLDADSARGILEVFRALNGRGMTILIVTHNAALLPFCRREVRCVDGHLAERPA